VILIWKDIVDGDVRMIFGLIWKIVLDTHVKELPPPADGAALTG
jgi:hypothetical protein